MNKKSMIYSLVSLLAGSAVAVVPITYGSKAQAQEPMMQANPAEAPTVGSPEAGMITPVDKAFIELMIPHHQAAVAKADLALERAKNPEIKQLAESVKKDRPREIQQMQTLYKQWYGTEVPASSAADMKMAHAMGMDNSRGSDDMNRGDRTGSDDMNRGDRRGNGHAMTEDGMNMMTMDLEALKNARDFDREFILRMIPYNEMAVMMAKMVVNSAEHPEIRNLAQTIIKDRTAENQQLKQMYQNRYK